MASQPRYQIAEYHPELREQAVDLLRYLLGDDRSTNLGYFAWKYEQNPYSEAPLGIVALSGGRVVGFRGYFATRWRVGGRDAPALVLSPADACVHPAHRRRGLSIVMAKLAMKIYAGRFAVFLNMSGGASSAPGYRRVGFVPVTPKTLLNRYSWPGLLRFLWSARRVRRGGRRPLSLGQSGDLLVSDRPRPTEMAALAAAQPAPDGKLALWQGEAFFRWRFGNPRNAYIFYYLLRDSAVSGYAVVGISPGSRGRILDLAGADSPALLASLEAVVAAGHFDVLSIDRFTVDELLAPALARLGFRAGGFLPLLERRMRGVFPVLVRPIVAECTEQDWLVGGLDVRRVESWAFKGICADNA